MKAVPFFSSYTAALKKANRLAIADAIILSKAIETRCSYLITFDTDFIHVGEIEVLTPQNFLELTGLRA